jgi:hypothetical protein
VSESLTAWQCIGCGRIEGVQPCVGICQDRKVEFVYAYEHEIALNQLQRASTRVRELEALVRQLAWTTPHSGAWEESFLAFRQRAHQMLAMPDNTGLEWITSR